MRRSEILRAIERERTRQDRIHGTEDKHWGEWLETQNGANGKRQSEPPDAPLVKLREQGVITVEEEVRLTSKAYARSLEL